jgi:hypothetical protein
VIVINRVDINGTRQDVSDWTYIEYTGTSGATLTGCTVISGGQDQALGKVVEFISDVTQQQRILDALANVVVIGTGAVDTTKVVDLTTAQALTNKTLTSPVINTGFSGTAKASATEVAAGTEDAKIVTPLAVAPYANSSMSRQAIMNGNFDVWQRGTSVALADVTVTYLADRWHNLTNRDGGTLPTITLSRQAHTPGDMPNSFYFHRINTNGAGSGLGNSSRAYIQQPIEYGTRFLCGLNKTVTLSFWAKSDIADKKLGVTLFQNYGTGGSPTATEMLTVTDPVITLSSSWTKYTYTVTTNTLSGKTFGTANDDLLLVKLNYVWGSTTATTYGLTGTSDFGGSGNIDIAQVQLCAGDVALPFQPKSFEEELRACQRYYEKSYDYGVAIGTSTELGALVTYDPVATGIFTVYFKVTKRKTPDMFAYSVTGAVGKYRDLSSGADFDATLGNLAHNSFKVGLATHGAADEVIGFHWTAEAEL